MARLREAGGDLQASISDWRDNAVCGQRGGRDDERGVRCQYLRDTSGVTNVWPTGDHPPMWFISAISHR